MLWTVLHEWKAIKCLKASRRIVSGQKCLRDLDLSVKILNDLNHFLGHCYRHVLFHFVANCVGFRIVMLLLLYYPGQCSRGSWTIQGPCIGLWLLIQQKQSWFCCLRGHLGRFKKSVNIQERAKAVGKFSHVRTNSPTCWHHCVFPIQIEQSIFLWEQIM